MVKRAHKLAHLTVFPESSTEPSIETGFPDGILARLSA